MKTEHTHMAGTRLKATILAAGCALAWGGIQAGEANAFLHASVAEATELDSLRGMSGETRIWVETNQQLNATVSGSSFSAGTINSGSVTFAENALENFSGIGLFNVVTGNNNAVESAIGVTFNLQ
jgi:hypothetical protein